MRNYYLPISLAESRWKSCLSQVFLGIRGTAGLFKIFKSYAYTREEKDKQKAGGQKLENPAGH
jgi:hypothetical protein